MEGSVTEEQAVIMVVDDNPMNIYVVSELLKSDNFKVDTALDGVTALSMIKQRIDQFAVGEGILYRLILLDFSMPGMDGPTVAKEIQKLYQESETVTIDKVPYICCCTAYTSVEFKNKALEAGMDHFLTKPISKQQLDELVTLLD